MGLRAKLSGSAAQIGTTALFLLKTIGIPLAIRLGLAAIQVAVKNPQSKEDMKGYCKEIHDALTEAYPEFAQE